MGSDGLIEPSSELRSWLREFAADTAEDVELRLGGVAAAIADHRGLSRPAALPTAEAVKVPGALCQPDLLGMAFETILAPQDRRQQGAHYTPPHVADEIVGLALRRLPGGSLPVVWDPTCGGGAFLLAAARALHADGHDRADIVRACHGTDIDTTALRVADASLELWAGGTARPSVEHVDLLTSRPTILRAGRARLVVGNPPFLGQLTSDTARTRERREALIDRFGDVAKGYVDDVGLIMLAAVEHAAPGAVAALVAPESFLGTKDAAAVRSALVERAAVEAVWLESGSTFEAAVDVVAPILVVGAAPARTTMHRGDEQINLPHPPPRNWAPVIAAAAGVPTVEPQAHGTLGDHATITAGFRQHFYGLQGAVHEADGDPDAPVELGLITSGVIDPLWNAWGQNAVRFGGQSWSRPVVDLDRIEDAAVAAWFAARRVPKLLVASQTRVVETIVDETGNLLPSVPVISIEPTETGLLWHLAAVVSSPVACARIATASAGTGLSRGSLRIRASELAQLPLPAPGPAWDEGAEAAHDTQQAIQHGDIVGYRTSLERLGHSMAEAYGVADADLVSWWCDRIRFPDESPAGVE